LIGLPGQLCARAQGAVSAATSSPSVAQNKAQ